MKKSAKVSIVIPCYNCEELVTQTLESLERQTYKNFEVICVNDGSKDNTYNLLLDYAKQSTLNMRIFTQENCGVSKTRNRAIYEAQGEYVLFLDADDMYHNRFIEYLLGAIEETKADVAYCRLNRDLDVVMNFSSDVRVVCQNQSEAMHNLLYRMGEFGFYCYVYKKDVLNRTNLQFDENTRFFEDREFNWKYLCHCNSAVLVDAPLYWYRVNPDSVTQNINKRKEWRVDGLNAVLRVEQYLQENNCEFYTEVKSYLFARVLWGSAMRYSRAGRKDFLKRLANEYDVKTCMKQVKKDKNWMVRLSARMYLISPTLFYHIVRLKR